LQIFQNEIIEEVAQYQVEPDKGIYVHVPRRPHHGASIPTRIFTGSLIASFGFILPQGSSTVVSEESLCQRSGILVRDFPTSPYSGSSVSASAADGCHCLARRVGE
jgi:hypothetical protein